MHLRKKGAIVSIFAGLAIIGSNGLAADEEIEALRKQTEYLAEELALARIEVDALKARIEYYEFGRTRSATLKPWHTRPEHAPVKVFDVNRDLRMLVVNAGEQEGLWPGMRFAVLRDSKCVAYVRVVDVRKKIAGAVVLDPEPGEFPEVGDLLIAAGGFEDKETK